MTLPAANLLDTNVVSEMMRRRPDRRVADFLDAIAREGLGLSVVTVWEILNGIGRIADGKRREDLNFRFRSLLDDVFEGRVYDWSVEDAEACAGIMEAKRRRGESLDSHVADSMIAAAAASHGMTLITRNEKDFRNTGIEVVNPWNSTPIIQQHTGFASRSPAMG